MEQVNIGGILKENREGRGYTVQRLSELLDVNMQTILDWEANVSRPDLIKSLLISRLYGVSLEDMFCDVNVDNTLTDGKKAEYQHEKWMNRIRNREY